MSTILNVVQRLASLTPSVDEAEKLLKNDACLRVGFVGSATAEIMNATAKEFLVPSSLPCVVELTSSTTPRVQWNFDTYVASDALEYNPAWKTLERVAYLKKKLTEMTAVAQKSPAILRKLEIHYPFTCPFSENVVLVQMPMPGSCHCDIVFESVDVPSLGAHETAVTLLQVNNPAFSTPVVQPFKALLAYVGGLSIAESQAFDECVKKMNQVILHSAADIRQRRAQQLVQAENILAQHVDKAYKILYAIRNYKPLLTGSGGVVGTTAPPPLNLSSLDLDVEEVSDSDSSPHELVTATRGQTGQVLTPSSAFSSAFSVDFSTDTLVRSESAPSFSHRQHGTCGVVLPDLHSYTPVAFQSNNIPNFKFHQYMPVSLQQPQHKQQHPTDDFTSSPTKENMSCAVPVPQVPYIPISRKGSAARIAEQLRKLDQEIPASSNSETTNYQPKCLGQDQEVLKLCGNDSNTNNNRNKTDLSDDILAPLKQQHAYIPVSMQNHAWKPPVNNTVA